MFLSHVSLSHVRFSLIDGCYVAISNYTIDDIIYIALDNVLKFHHYRINVIVFPSANNCCTTQLKHCKEMIPLGKNSLCYPEELGNRNNKAALLRSMNQNGILNNLYVPRYS